MIGMDDSSVASSAHEERERRGGAGLEDWGWVQAAARKQASGLTWRSLFAARLAAWLPGCLNLYSMGLCSLSAAWPITLETSET